MEAILVGYSGHGLVVAETAMIMGINIFGYTDITKKNKNPYKFKHLGYEKSKNFKYWDKNKKYILGIGSNLSRSKTFNFIKAKGHNFLKIISPNASISKFSITGEGTFIARNVTINPFAEIGDYCIINSSSSIDHECILSDGVHIAPGAILCGNVKIGKNTFIGANSVLKEGVEVGENAIIGAGSVVLSNVKKNSVVYGRPAK
jgi:sugar O-acyltransferase (sialic acid O-acetyltransferase NeuD family)